MENEMNMSAISRIRLGSLLCVIGAVSGGSLTAQPHVRLVLMPSQTVAVEPSEGQIQELLDRHGASLNMTAEELVRDLPMASSVLAQQSVFSYVSDFREQTQIGVKVRFVSWTEAIRYLTDYVSVPTNPPLVAEIGDSWAAYFRSLGVVHYEKTLLHGSSRRMPYHRVFQHRG